MQETVAPPTPPVSLAALLSREDLALRQITGPPAAEVAVHWAHTSEMADPYPYLLGGELLLTAGVHIPSGAGTQGYFDAYVARIVAAGGAALGFGVAPVHDTVPRALVAACEVHGLPLVEVPPQTTFSGVARAVWQLMARARLAELRRVSEAQRQLAAAASRPDPVPSVLRRLAARLDGRAVLYGPDGAEIAAAGREPGDEVRGALAKLARFVTSRASTTATDTVAGTRLAAYALGTGGGFVLGVAAPQRESGDHTIASVAAVLLSLLTGEHQSGTGAARSSALVRLLLGARPEEVAPLLDGGADTRWHVVHARPDSGCPDPVAASALGAALGSPLVDPSDDVVRVLVPAGPETPGGPGPAAGVPPEQREAEAVTGPSTPAGPRDSAAGGTPATPPRTEAPTGPGTPGAATRTGTPTGPGVPGAATRTGAPTGPGTPGAATRTGTSTGSTPTTAPRTGTPTGPGTTASRTGAPNGPGAPGAATRTGTPTGSTPTTAPRTGTPTGPGTRTTAPRTGAPAGPGVPAGAGPAPQRGWTLGVSAAVAPAEWAAADAQAARALARARATRVPLVRHAARPALADLVPDAEADAHARALLAPIAAVPALTETLRAWLSLHGSWDRTAVALSVHRNTVRQRVARCAALLDADLDDADVRMELWFALRRL
ncbi:PucR family transcriptional regulator [Streptomyces sp. CL12-4]|uniref:PucR family transcriptional regulator n=1 Tax=Streptomyces sp. CL12-4 TaxID=2810306 RepID=UPI001EFBB294|nr:PucR family transcriptional regulator [Streptomyces sp. CL12-4]MCG8967446.1 PucR family transcriptional regulator ligand-binding domain-containing protein [Streptomyces sp. CL12-4]